MASDTESEEPRKKKRRLSHRRRSNPEQGKSSFTDLMNVHHNKGANVNIRKNAIGNQITMHISSSATSKRCLKKSASDLREKLIAQYKEATLPNESWMDNGGLLLGKYYVPLELHCDSQPVLINQLLDCKRILIEAPPGYGKSTLAHKIAFDWAWQEDYVNHFKFAFLITLGNLQQDWHDVLDAMVDIAHDGNKKDIVKEVICKFTNETLVILDGLDELQNKKFILKTISGMQLHTATVVVTCRTASFQLTAEEKKSFNLSRSYQFFKRKVNITGLSVDNRRKLLRNLIEREEKVAETEEKIAEIEDKIKPVENLFECPLFGSLLAYTVVENSDIRFRTTTELCKHLVEMVAWRNISKNNNSKKLPTNFSEFRTCRLFQQYRSALQELGKLSTSCFNSGKLQFECNKETQAMYRMGFLIKCESKTNFSVKYHYEGINLAVLGFATAYSLSTKYKSNPNVLKAEKSNSIIKLFEGHGESSMAIPFLCRMLRKNIPNLFTQLNSKTTIYSSPTCNVWYIVDDFINTCKLPPSMYVNPGIIFKNVESLKESPLRGTGKKFQKVKFCVSRKNELLPADVRSFINQLTVIPEQISV